MIRRDQAAREAASALAALRGGDVDQALTRLHRVVDQNPRHVEARLAYGEAQLEVERFADAVATTTIGIGLSKDDARGHHLRARAQAGRGKPTEALEDARSAVALAPGWAEAQLLRGWLELDHGNLLEAAEAAERVIAIDRGHPDGHALLAEVALVSEHWDILAVSSRAVLRLRRNDQRARELLSYAEQRQAEQPSGLHAGGVASATEADEPKPVPEAETRPAVEAAGPDLVAQLRADEAADTGPSPDGSGTHARQTDHDPAATVPPAPTEEASGSARRRPRETATPRLLAAAAVLPLVAVLALALRAPVWVAVLLVLAGVTTVGIALSRRRPLPDQARERVRAQLGVPDGRRAADRPAATGESAPGNAPAAAESMQTPPDTTSTPDQVSLTHDESPTDDESLADERSGRTIHVPPVTDERVGEDEIARLRGAADRAIEGEDWQEAESCLRRLLELEPLYMPAHGRLTYVLNRQRPTRYPRLRS